jgi:hypothetical protein
MRWWLIDLWIARWRWPLNARRQAVAIVRMRHERANHGAPPLSDERLPK